ncbi:Mono(ADP-ribosyl)transferase SpvB [Pandoraea aquatica]|uniref:Mono(ADP-ribosyl)transferase SpvB n=1 Tax=Pandoraea aquatica TaxID=2508290 RepID=A0A5E4RAJ7_9BURK|nr:SpvB/TcaC N-terminal domain-containing protein [Pandoraea aquatica]VVD60217.1 Mono(ADP-ribosyl)transferase SpvB [Pandoraea aquatica]
MNDPSANIAIAPPALPKGGGAIQSIGNTLGTVGVTGAATLSVALPVSAGRGFAPSLALAYSSQSGKSAFGQGWQMVVPHFARRTGKGTPVFDDTDDILGPGGEVLVPEIDRSGQPVTHPMSEFRGVELAQRYTVTRYFARVLSSAERIEFWHGDDDGEQFWVVHDDGGAVHIYGKLTRTEAPGIAPNDTPRIAQWWLDESVAPNGEQMPAMPGLNDGEQYQLVDLYGDGMAGVLHRAAGAWYYREPIRADTAHANDVSFGPPVALPQVPPSRWPSAEDGALRQTLTDFTGDGRLDWLVVQPGFAGYFTLAPDRTWSNFIPFAAFPTEFTHLNGQLADLMGEGLQDFAMIGPRSVRLYANRREDGFAPPVDVAQDSPLPGLADARSELVAFADFLGCGQPQLVRIRHSEVTLWPNLGHGRFGSPRLFAKLPYKATDFDAARVRLADLDGSGAVDFIYLYPTQIEILHNAGGNGWARPFRVPWPEGVMYDPTCEVTFADLNGLGCASLVLTVPHMTPRHWRCDFVTDVKPYLLEATDNNMGLSSTLRYRSSAQEWLDEKHALQAQGLPAVSGIPFALHLVAQQTQLDQITGNALCQQFQYRHGYYDPHERELRGFGLLLQSDAEMPPDGLPPEDGFTAPVQTRTWHHVGRDTEPNSDPGFDTSDPDALPLRPVLRCAFAPDTNTDTPSDDWDDDTARDMARALSGSVRRVETFGLDDASRPPYAVAQTRYLVRVMQPRSAHARYAVVRPLTVESRTHRYERQPSDPQCDHVIGLRWNAMGLPLLAAQVHYARRNGPPPFDAEDVWQIKWWEDAHDDAQRTTYVTQTQQTWRAVDHDDRWHPALPARTRADAIAFHDLSLDPAKIHYEAFIATDGPLNGGDERALVAMSENHYPLEDPSEWLALAGLVEYQEHAELDDLALLAYEDVLAATELESELEAAGYHRMTPFLPDTPMTLWSVHRECFIYDGLDAFYLPSAWRAARSLGDTAVEYDAYRCAPKRVIAPDGCATQATLDYRAMQPAHIVDPNGNSQEMRYDGLGRPVASSFHGTVDGEPAGFMPLSDYVREFDSPDDALAEPESALQDVASAWFFDALAWMGSVEESSRSSLSSWVERRWVMPDGRVRSSGRLAAHAALASRAVDGTSASEHASTDATPAMSNDVAQTLLGATRRPPHGLQLQADRYPNDPKRQIRIQIVDSDGFGRVLQEKQLVPPGDAYEVQDDGTLALDDEGRPVVSPADPRWRVSERVEYNNKGLTVRVYRPYFASTHRYVNDTALRESGYCDRQYYDPLGRPTVTLTAHGYMRRETYWPWHTVSEDENDTAHELDATSDGVG